MVAYTCMPALWKAKDFPFEAVWYIASTGAQKRLLPQAQAGKSTSRPLGFGREQVAPEPYFLNCGSAPVHPAAHCGPVKNICLIWSTLKSPAGNSSSPQSLQDPVGADAHQLFEQRPD